MTGWLPSLRVAGVAVRVHALLFAVPVVLAATAPRGEGEVGWRLGVFASLVACVLVHELGHAVAARARGLAAEVRVHAFGAWARVERREPPAGTPADEWVVALAGPGASLLLAALLHVALPGLEHGWPAQDLRSGLDDPWRATLWISAAMGAVNLLPVLPLDGGRVLRALLVAPMGHRRATAVAVATSGIAAASLLVLAVRLGDPWAVLVLGAGALFVLRAALLERRAPPAPP